MITVDLDDIEKMDGNKRNALFLATFKSLEAYFSRLVNSKAEYISFSQALNTAYSKKLTPGILTGENYDFLKSASEFRNLLSHNNDVCYATPSFLLRFLTLADGFLYPVKAIDISTLYEKLIMCSCSSNVLETIKKMRDGCISHVPVVEGGKLQGIFSAGTLFDIAADDETQFSKNWTMKDILPYLNRHSNEDFVYVKPSLPAVDVSSLFNKSASHQKRTAVVFVTSDGTSKGMLLGMITPADLLKIKS